jgi:hypothetical protein
MATKAVLVGRARMLAVDMRKVGQVVGMRVMVLWCVVAGADVGGGL